MKRIAFLIFVFALFSLPACALEIAYTISMPQPVTHYFHVQIDLTDVAAVYIDVRMPAWSPGRYLIRNFARNVRDFSAKGKGEGLRSRKIDQHTWRIDTKGQSQITIHYKVYGNNLAGDFSQLNDFHAFLDGGSLYMYIVGHKPDPVRLTVVPPDDWMILSSAGELGQTEFTFPNYDLMIDDLVQLGVFFVERFKIENTEYRVCILNNGEREPIPEFVEKVHKMQQTVVEMLGPLDTECYTYFYHFLPDSRDSAGMEHLNCCQLTRKHDISDTGTLMDWTLWVTAHELTHAWNVKRLRPKELGPWDYQEEAWTPLLWLAEGGTNYFAHMIITRSGVWTKEKLYERLQNDIQDFRNSPARFQRSPEQASYDTFLWQRLGDTYGESNWENTWLSYYLTGQLVSMCIDFEIRHQTKNQKTFEDFFRLLYQRCYEEAESDSYYFKGRAYTTKDVLKALEDTTGTRWDHFYETLVASPGEINLAHYLSFAALKLKTEDHDPPLPYTGLTLASGQGGFPKITSIHDQAPAGQAGLDRHDLLIALDKERVLYGDFNTVLRRHAIDGEIEITLLRDDRLLERVLHLQEGWNVVKYKIEESSDFPPLARKIRRSWLWETK